MTDLADRSGPGVRITVLSNERAPSGEPLNLDGRILGFTYEDAERKADQVAARRAAMTAATSSGRFARPRRGASPSVRARRPSAAASRSM